MSSPSMSKMTASIGRGNMLVLSTPCRCRCRPQEIEIAALIRLQHALMKQPGIAAGGRRGRGWSGRGAARKLGVVNQNIDPPRRHVEPDAVAACDQRQR